MSVLSSRGPKFWYDVSTTHTIGSIRNKEDVNEKYKNWIEAKKASVVLLDDLACCESWSNRVDLDLHVITRLCRRNEDNETFNSCDPVTATAGLFDVKLILLTFLNWLGYGSFKAHAFHLSMCCSASCSGDNLDVDTDDYGRTYVSARISN